MCIRDSVYMASAAPPVRYQNVYGIDMPAPTEFVAHEKSVDEICKVIGADKLIYQDLDDLIEAVSHSQADVTEFDCSCFDGKYVTGDVTPEYLRRIELLRCDEAKEEQAKSIPEEINE